MIFDIWIWIFGHRNVASHNPGQNKIKYWGHFNSITKVIFLPEILAAVLLQEAGSVRITIRSRRRLGACYKELWIYTELINIWSEIVVNSPESSSLVSGQFRQLKWKADYHPGAHPEHSLSSYCVFVEMISVLVCAHRENISLVPCGFWENVLSLKET